VNFFDAQDRARRATRWLVVVYVVATILIVLGITTIVVAALITTGDTHAVPPMSLIAGTAATATLFIVGATIYKTSLLSSGGGRVALDMGGTLISPDVQDPLRRRLRNVVEEMAIASGVPVPEIYVLEEENGINAFAAGFAPGDAAVAVTRGCLELLDRNELQGVIAHEFSHILNGDMRLNIRMMGVLFGIMVLGIIGRFILRSSYYGSSMSSRRDKSAPVILMIGLGLAILGWVGVFFARLIKASVSRQREFLADASAVQFTRQTEGLANALKKIGGYSDKSYIQNVDPEEVSHMLFAGGAARLTSLFATHPPLIERINALDPNFDESDYPEISLHTRDQAAKSEAIAGFSAEASAALSAIQSTSIADTVTDAIGRPEPRHVIYAQKLRSSIPPALYAAAHSPDDSLLLAIALSLGSSEAESASQLRLIEEQIGGERTGSIRRFHTLILEAGPGYRLPLLEIAFPMLKKRPAAQIEFLLQLVGKLVRQDGRVNLSEFCYYRILESHLLQAAHPARKPGNRVSKNVARQAAVNLIRLVADRGHDDPEERQRAFDAGAAFFGGWAGDHDTSPDTSNAVAILDDSLAALRRMNSAGRQSLIRAVTKTIAYDGRLTLSEAELLRAICATLDCPMPPILADNPISSSS
jgi:Zn-dependent protease with chaperone function